MPIVVDGISIPIDAVDNVSKIVSGIDASFVKLVESEVKAAKRTEMLTKIRNMTLAEQELFLAENSVSQAMQNQTAAESAQASATGKSIGSWTELSSAIGLAKQAYQVAGQVADETFGKYQKLASEVRDLTIATGTNATEASTLLQVFGDFDIKAEDVTTAMKAMKEKGMVPTLDVLADLSDKFIAIKNPAERLQFAQDNLGKSSSKYFNILSQGGDVLRQHAADIEKNLILNDQQIKDAERARLAVDAWNDSIEGIKVQTGSWIGQQIIYNQQAEKAYDILRKNGEIVNSNTRNTKEFADALKQVQIEEFTGGLDSAGLSYRAMAEAAEKSKDVIVAASEEEIKAQEEANKALQQSNADAIKGAIDIQKSQDDYIKSQDEISAKIAELQAQKEQYYPWEVNKINETQDKIDELSQKYEEGADAFIEAEKKKLSMMAVEKIAMEDGVAGFSDAEFAKAKAILETTDIATAAAFDQQQAEQMLTDAIVNGTIPSVQMYGDILKKVSEDGKISVDEVTAALNAIPKNTDVNINVTTNVAQSGANYNPYATGAGPGFAEGGISTGSPSGHLEMLHGTEAVIPLKNGSVPVEVSGGGNSGRPSWVNDLIAAIQSTRLDESRFEQLFTSSLKRGVI